MVNAMKKGEGTRCAHAQPGGELCNLETPCCSSRYGSQFLTTRHRKATARGVHRGERWQGTEDIDSDSKLSVSPQVSSLKI